MSYNHHFEHALGQIERNLQRISKVTHEIGKLRFETIQTEAGERIQLSFREHVAVGRDYITAFLRLLDLDGVYLVEFGDEAIRVFDVIIESTLDHHLLAIGFKHENHALVLDLSEGIDVRRIVATPTLTPDKTDWEWKLTYFYGRTGRNLIEHPLDLQGKGIEAMLRSPAFTRKAPPEVSTLLLAPLEIDPDVLAVLREGNARKIRSMLLNAGFEPVSDADDAPLEKDGMRITEGEAFALDVRFRGDWANLATAPSLPALLLTRVELVGTQFVTTHVGLTDFDVRDDED